MTADDGRESWLKQSMRWTSFLLIMGMLPALVVWFVWFRLQPQRAEPPRSPDLTVDLSRPAGPLVIDGRTVREDGLGAVAGNRLVTVRSGDAVLAQEEAQRIFLRCQDGRTTGIDLHLPDMTAAMAYEKAKALCERWKIGEPSTGRLEQWHARSSLTHKLLPSVSMGLPPSATPYYFVEIMHSFNDARPYYISVQIRP